MAAIGASVARTCFEGPRLSVSNSRAIIGWQTRAVKGEAAPLLLFGGVHARPFGKEPQTSSARSALLACLTSGREYNRLLNSLFKARSGVAGHRTKKGASWGKRPLTRRRMAATLSPRRGLSSAGRRAPSPLGEGCRVRVCRAPSPLGEGCRVWVCRAHSRLGEGCRVGASPRFVLRGANILRPSAAREQSRKGQVTKPVFSVRCWL